MQSDCTGIQTYMRKAWKSGVDKIVEACSTPLRLLLLRCDPGGRNITENEEGGCSPDRHALEIRSISVDRDRSRGKLSTLEQVQRADRPYENRERRPIYGEGPLFKIQTRRASLGGTELEGAQYERKIDGQRCMTQKVNYTQLIEQALWETIRRDGNDLKQ
eukprot:IDg12519t1